MCASVAQTYTHDSLEVYGWTSLGWNGQSGKRRQESGFLRCDDPVAERGRGDASPDGRAIGGNQQWFRELDEDVEDGFVVLVDEAVERFRVHRL